MCTHIGILLGLYLRVELLHHRLSLTFQGTAKQISKVTAPFYIPIRNPCGFQFLYILVNICLFLDYSHLGRYEAVLMVWVCISLMKIVLSIFSCSCWPLCLFFGGIPPQIFAHLINGVLFPTELYDLFFLFLLSVCISDIFLFLNTHPIE